MCIKRIEKKNENYYFFFFIMSNLQLLFTINLQKETNIQE